MRITAGMTGVLLIAAVAIAQDDNTAATAVSQDAAVAEQVEAAKKHVAIGSVSATVTKNAKTGVKTQVVKVTSEQDADSPFVGTMRLTVEMEDGTNLWYGQQQQTQKKRSKTKGAGAGEGELDYTGEDSWSFSVPIGQGTALERPEIKAYAVEYGFMAGNKFVAVAAKFSRVDSTDEITTRHQGSKNILKIKSSGKALKKGEGVDSGGGE